MKFNEEQINISEYVQQIEAASSQADVKTIFNTAKAYVLERIEQIDLFTNYDEKDKTNLLKKEQEKKATELYEAVSEYGEDAPTTFIPD